MTQIKHSLDSSLQRLPGGIPGPEAGSQPRWNQQLPLTDGHVSAKKEWSKTGRHGSQNTQPVHYVEANLNFTRKEFLMPTAVLWQ